jgi:hypothetical protein
MKGDFSRIRFNPKKQYTAVLEQQGRVSLDADANEQCAIDGYLRRTETVDVIGEYGGPANDEGFAISVSGNEILIGAGRYYVDGLMCENRQDNLAYGSQAYLLDPSPADSALLADLKQQGGAVQVFLQAWQRLVTALDDSCLREPALGQADTTARIQTVWRVVAKLKPANPMRARAAASLPQRPGLAEARVNVPSELAARKPGKPGGGAPAPSPQDLPTVNCCAEMYQQSNVLSTGAMAAMTSGGSDDCSCQPIPAAGYHGLENQLYRVEIHQGGDAAKATFKWSRENGSVVAAITSLSGPTVWVNSLGPDANLGFQANDWVEISDDTYLFGQTPNQPGSLYQILSVDPTGPSITLKTPATPVDPARNARVRRWDQSGSSAGSTGVSLTTNAWYTLENGIQVEFNAGTYQSGDYWTIPARAASGLIDWPPCGSDGNLFQPPVSVPVFNAPLACIHWDTTKKPAQFVVDDCRKKFSPLTDLTPEDTAPALHVTNYSWQNDDITTFDQLLSSGLTVSLDNAPTGPVNGANFIVSLEVLNINIFAAGRFDQAAVFSSRSLSPTATALTETGAAAGPVPGAAAPAEAVSTPPAEPVSARKTVRAAAGTAPSTVKAKATSAPVSVGPTGPAAVVGSTAPVLAVLSSLYTPVYQVLPLSVFILDWKVSVKASAKQIVWQLPSTDLTSLQFRFLELINNMIGAMAEIGLYARARVKLLGEDIFAQSGNTQMFLDGQSFGLQSTRQDGKTACISLQMPSGNRAKASDFEGWFYLAPFNSVLSVSTNFPGYTVVVNQNNIVTGVVAGNPPAAVTAQVTVTLRYPAVMAGGVTVDLVVTAVTAGVPANSFVSLATTKLVIPQGSSSGTVNINAVGNPGLDNAGKPVTDTFQITASAELAYGNPQSQSTTFTLTGVPPVIVIF